MKPSNSRVLILGLAAALMLSACDRGEKLDTTQNQALLKAQCSQHANGKVFNPQAFVKKRQDELAKHYGSSSFEKLIRTYVTKVKSILTSNTATEAEKSYVDVSAIPNIVSTQTISEFQDEAYNQNQIVVTLRCQDLKADVDAPGVRLQDMNFVGIAVNEEAGLDARKQVLLTKTEGDKEIRILVGQYFDESKLNADAVKAAVKAESERALKTLKFSMTVTQLGQEVEALELIQRAGHVQDDVIIAFDFSAVERLWDQMGDEAPAEIKKFMNSDVQTQMPQEDAATGMYEMTVSAPVTLQVPESTAAGYEKIRKKDSKEALKKIAI